MSNSKEAMPITDDYDHGYDEANDPLKPYVTVHKDGEVSDESFDPKYVKEVLELWKEDFDPIFRDSEWNEYKLVDGECVLYLKFIDGGFVKV